MKRPSYPFSEARWIGIPTSVEDAHFVFRRCLSLDHKPAAAPIRITADARYILWVNGEFVGRGPARGYPFAQPYDEYDIVWCLREGMNWIAAQVYQFGPGIDAFNNGDKGNGVHVFTGKTGLIVEGELIRTDASWQTRPADWHLPVAAPYIHGCFGFQEFLDARREPAGWRVGENTTLMQSLSDAAHAERASRAASGGWQPAREIAAPGEVPWTGFEPRGLRPMRETRVGPLPLVAAFIGASDVAVNDHKALKTLWEQEKLESVQNCPEGAASFPPPADADGWIQVMPPARGFVALTFDLGWNPTAYPRIEVREGRGGEILDSGYATLLGPDNHPAVLPGACDRFIAAAGGSAWQSFLPRGYRYHTVKVRADHPVTLRVGAVVAHHDVAGLLPFACSDDGLTRAWDVSDRTLRANMLDAFLDNNWREQTQWLHDGCVGALGAWASYGDTSLWRRLLRQTAQSAQVFADGSAHSMPACDPLYQRSVMPICDYTATFLTSLEQFHAVTGDDDLLREVLPCVRGLVLRFLESGFTEDHLFLQPPGSKIFLDWTTRPFDKSPYNLTLNLSVLRGLESAGYLAETVNEPELAVHCRRRATELRRATVARFWSEEHSGWLENIAPSERVKRALIDNLPAGWLEDPWQPGVLSFAVNKEPTRCTRHANALAVLLRLGSPDQQAAAAKLVGRAFDPGHDCNNGMSPLWTDKIFGSLFEAGEDADAVRLLQQTYGKWAAEGALHWGEGFGASHAAQLCGSSVNWLLSGYVLGIRPDADNPGAWLFDPRPGNLDWAKGEVPTPHGIIRVEWARGANGEVQAEITKPEGIAIRSANGRTPVIHHSSEIAPAVGEHLVAHRAGGFTPGQPPRFVWNSAPGG